MRQKDEFGNLKNVVSGANAAAAPIWGLTCTDTRDNNRVNLFGQYHRWGLYIAEAITYPFPEYKEKENIYRPYGGPYKMKEEISPMGDTFSLEPKGNYKLPLYTDCKIWWDYDLYPTESEFARHVKEEETLEEIVKRIMAKDPRTLLPLPVPTPEEIVSPPPPYGWNAELVKPQDLNYRGQNMSFKIPHKDEFGNLTDQFSMVFATAAPIWGLMCTDSWGASVDLFGQLHNFDFYIANAIIWPSSEYREKDNNDRLYGGPYKMDETVPMGHPFSIEPKENDKPPLYTDCTIWWFHPLYPTESEFARHVKETREEIIGTAMETDHMPLPSLDITVQDIDRPLDLSSGGNWAAYYA